MNGPHPGHRSGAGLLELVEVGADRVAPGHHAVDAPAHPLPLGLDGGHGLRVDVLGVDAAVIGQRVEELPEFTGRLARAFDLSVAPEERFATFDRPALVITGRQDSAVGYEDQFDLLVPYPRMTYVALDRAGHNAHLDQPELSRALFSGWLDQMSA